MQPPFAEARAPDREHVRRATEPPCAPLPSRPTTVAGCALDASCSDASPGNGACDTGATVLIGGSNVAECTLRAAIEEANAFAGRDVIVVDPETPPSSGSNLQIVPQSVLPIVTETVLIDGRTAPGYLPGSAATLSLSGSGVSDPDGNGLEFRDPGASDSALYAVEIRGFPADGVRVVNTDGFRMHSCHIGTTLGFFASGNGDAGIDIGFGATDTVVLANRVGTDIDGETALPNALGIRVRGSRTRIGSTTDGGNLVSGNSGTGLYLGDFDGSPSDITVVGNRIGVDEDVALPLGNGGDGIIVDDLSNVVIRANVIGANGRKGIYALDAAPRVYGNWIGTNEAGANLGNVAEGVDCRVGDCEIGGDLPGQGKTIGFNGGYGVELVGDRARVLYNDIGVDAVGRPMGNGEAGLRLAANADSEIRGNAIGHNPVGILTFADEDVVVEGNSIGVDRLGNPAANTSHGIQLLTSDRVRIGVVGSTARPTEAGNTIANNGGTGVFVDDFGTDPLDVTIRGNGIYGNAGLPIALGTEAGTLNDPGDGDVGPNLLLNAPEIDEGGTSYDDTSQTLTVRYRVDSALANADYPLRIEFYTMDGRFWIGEDLYPAAAAGSFRTTTISVTPIGFSGEAFVGATATDRDGRGSTSQLGVSVAVPEPDQAWSLPVLALVWLRGRRRGAGAR